MERRLQELYKAKLDVQDRINKAAALGDLSENAEYHFAKEENRSISRELAELEAKIKNTAVVKADDVPEDTVFLGHTVKLLDLDDDSEQLVKIVGEAQPPGGDDVLPVSATSPMGEALMKAKIGDKIKVRAPRGTMEFKILEIVR
jgi:transcription elongation factor GreA